MPEGKRDLVVGLAWSRRHSLRTVPLAEIVHETMFPLQSPRSKLIEQSTAPSTPRSEGICYGPRRSRRQAAVRNCFRFHHYHHDEDVRDLAELNGDHLNAYPITLRAKPSGRGF